MAFSVQESFQAVLWPRAPRRVELGALAKRHKSLDGKVIAQLWDYLFRGDEIFPILERELSKRFPGVRFVNFDVFGSTHGDVEHQVLAQLPEKLKRHKVDAVISGMAC